LRGFCREFSHLPLDAINFLQAWGEGEFEGLGGTYPPVGLSQGSDGSGLAAPRTTVDWESNPFHDMRGVDSEVRPPPSTFPCMDRGRRVPIGTDQGRNFAKVDDVTWRQRQAERGVVDLSGEDNISQQGGRRDVAEGVHSQAQLERERHLIGRLLVSLAGRDRDVGEEFGNYMTRNIDRAQYLRSRENTEGPREDVAYPRGWRPGDSESQRHHHTEYIPQELPQTLRTLLDDIVVHAANMRAHGERANTNVDRGMQDSRSEYSCCGWAIPATCNRQQTTIITTLTNNHKETSNERLCLSLPAAASCVVRQHLTERGEERWPPVPHRGIWWLW
jgi:hypothetical protein